MISSPLCKQQGKTTIDFYRGASQVDLTKKRGGLFGGSLKVSASKMGQNHTEQTKPRHHSSKFEVRDLNSN
jgi:hypothetical protein